MSPVLEDQFTHHSDHPTLDDKLDRTAAVKYKAKQINACSPPQVFGIHGDWGSGKTSFLHQLRYHLDGQHSQDEKTQIESLEPEYEGNIITIWFDAWRYQHEKAPIIALLHEIRSQFGALSKFKKSAGKIANITVNSILNSFSDVAKLLTLEAIPVDVKGIQKLGEKWEKEHLENKLGTDTLQDFLEQAISVLLKESLPHKSMAKAKNSKLVIMIDDLDRCSPSSAYRLLEGLKVYLSLKNCVFVIGMNQKIVIEAIAEQLSEGREFGDSPEIRGEAYLEKMCNSVERLNPLSDCSQFLQKWINNVNFDQELVKALTNDSGNTISCLPPNPRRLKALANILNQWAPLVDLCTEQTTTDVITRKTQALVIIAYIYQFHGEIFQRWQFTPSFYSHLVKWVKNTDPTKKWENYLENLVLPEIIEETDPNAAIVETRIQSNFPDPYAANVFWIAPLISYADLSEEDINPILKIVSQGNR